MEEAQQHHPEQSVSPTRSVPLDEIHRRLETFLCRTGIDSVNVRNSSLMGIAGPFLGVNLNDMFVPSGESLRGPWLQSELIRMEILVMDIQSSWKTSGCSVLIDGWRGKNGRQLINVLVDCPKGVVYLKSVDISAAIGDSNALMLFFDEITEDVGADNIVQVISNDTSRGMKIVGKLLVEKYPTIFWTVGSTHCLETMLEIIGAMTLNKNILKNAQMLTNFIYTRPTILMLMRKHISSGELVKETNIKSTMRFLTLENIVLEKKNLEKMFASSEWRSSVWASSNDGKRIADMVRDASFWSGALVVLKATIPLVKAIYLIQECANPAIGFIYETMDQVKETIRDEFEEEEVAYMPYWKSIDNIWNSWLHSPLHSAAYFLNPLYRYSTDFESNDEVMRDLYFCISHMVKEKKLQRLINIQVGQYEKGKGTFGYADAIQQSLSISSVQWWSCYSKECPELQSLAIRILSQTCDGASKYNLNKSLAEKFLSDRSDKINQKLLKDHAFCNYNMQLREFVPGPRNRNCTVDPMNDMTVDETLDRTLLDSDPTGMEVDSSRRTTSLGEGTSGSAQ